MNKPIATTHASHHPKSSDSNLFFGESLLLSNLLKGELGSKVRCHSKRGMSPIASEIFLYRKGKIQRKFSAANLHQKNYQLPD
jgi:hypothetical protein